MVGDRRRTFPLTPWIERIAAWLFLLLALPGTVIAAEATSPEERAAVHLEAGNARLEQGDIAGAIAEYRAGHALFPRANFLFNIGGAELRRGGLVEAAEAFAAVLARPETTPEVAAQAREELVKVEEQLTRLELKVDPLGHGAGAALTVDGQARGKLPLHQPLRLLPGVHDVRASKPGYRPFQRQVTGQPGATISLISVLEPLPPPPGKPRYWLWATVGAAVATAAVISIVALSGKEHPRDPMWECSDQTACVWVPR